METLRKINSPEDLKKLNNDELINLSKEIRKFIVNSLSKTGGHLASNLGIVEVTIALHYVFDSPNDKFIFDVSHQSYVHKIITGRLKGFSTLRKFDGMSGFTKSTESHHDYFDCGHSSNSISIAQGYAVSEELKGSTNRGIAIIGDGAMTGGMAYEAMYNAKENGKNLIVILNDNEMSISGNIGFLNKKVSTFRLNENYNRFKADLKTKLHSMDGIGDNIENKLSNIRDMFKNALIDGVIFEELGFKYYGPFDGHNLKNLIDIMSKLKDVDGPILLHIKTKKGYGYKPALKSPCDYHGVTAFDIKSGKSLTEKRDTYSNIAANTVLELAKEDKRIVAITAAMSSGTGLTNFEKYFPERFFDTGITEGHTLTFASSMAKNGIVPFVFIYSTFLQRGYDQIVEDIALQNSHMVICIDRAGLVGADGETHQGIFDISFLSHIPNLTFMAPKDSIELIEMIKFAMDLTGPVAIRYPRAVAEYTNEITNIEYGKSEVITSGEDVCIITVGHTYSRGKKISEMLLNKNISTAHINARFINPINSDTINSIKDFKYIFVIEDNLKVGGYGSKLLLDLMENSFIGKFKVFGFESFVTHGDIKNLNRKYNLDINSIFLDILDTIGVE